MGWSEMTSQGTEVIGIDNGGDVDGVILQQTEIEPLREKVLVDLYNCCLHISKQQTSLVVRETAFGVSDQVRHKPDCTGTEDD